ncbi:Putative ribonuclease H protein At1g65750, partial [Linum perenne]
RFFSISSLEHHICSTHRNESLRRCPLGWTTLNTNGSVYPQSGNAAADVLIHDNLRCYYKAFSVNLGRCSIIRAERRGIIVGLDVAWEVGIWKVACQLDSQMVVALISNNGASSHPHATKVLTIWNILQHDWAITNVRTI